MSGGDSKTYDSFSKDVFSAGKFKLLEDGGTFENFVWSDYYISPALQIRRNNDIWIKLQKSQILR